MEINFTLSLPRDALSVPVVRRVLRTSMNSLGVDADCVSDIEIALTEACTNVLDHAQAGDEYEVVARVTTDLCLIDVIDGGAGFDSEPLGHGDADVSSEAGRGIQLIRALVDSVHFTSGTERGTVVHFEKRLVLADDTPMRALSSRGGRSSTADLAAVERMVEERDQALREAQHVGGTSA